MGILSILHLLNCVDQINSIPLEIRSQICSKHDEPVRMTNILVLASPAVYTNSLFVLAQYRGVALDHSFTGVALYA